MTNGWLQAGDLLAGPLRLTTSWPCTLHVRLCDLRPRFLVKQVVAERLRAVARNGCVLLCADRSLDQLADRIARVRLQTWNRSILTGDTPRPYGVLLCVRCLTIDEARGPLFGARLAPRAEAGGELCLDVGGGLVLEFRADS